MLNQVTSISIHYSFKLIGRNTISNTLYDRQRNVAIPASEQYMVEEGDIIGVYFTKEKGVCIPYDLCKLNLQKFGDQKISVNTKGKASAWNVNQNYEFKEHSGDTVCKTWSFSVIIQ